MYIPNLQDGACCNCFFIVSKKGYINLFENCKLIHDTRRYVIVIKVTLYSSQIFPYISLRILEKLKTSHLFQFQPSVFSFLQRIQYIKFGSTENKYYVEPLLD